MAQKKHRITVKAQRRRTPDLRRLGAAALALAQADAERAAKLQHDQEATRKDAS